MVGSIRSHSRWSLPPIVLLGFGLRLIQLGAQSLWYDETVSVHLAGLHVGELVAATSRDIHPPLYYVLLRLFLSPAGLANGAADAATHRLEFLAAFLSLVFGVLLIPLVYLLGRRLFDEATAIVAGLLVAISSFHIWYSQEVRMYTLGAFLGVLCLLGALGYHAQATVGPGSSEPLLQTGNPRRWKSLMGRSWQSLLLYLLSSALGLYSLYYFAFLLIALNVWVLLSFAFPIKRAADHDGGTSRRFHSRWPAVVVWLVTQVLVLVLYVPWMPIAWRQAVDPPVPPWRSFVGLWPMAVETWNALCFGQSSHWRDTWPLLIMMLILLAYGAGRRTRSKGSLSFPAVPLLVHSLGSMAIVVLLSLSVPLYHVRYAFTYAAPFAVVISAGLVRLTRGEHSRRFLAPAALGAIVLASGLSLWEFWTDQAYAADDHRSAVQWMEDQWRPGDAIVVNAGYAYTALTTYWQKPIGTIDRLGDYDPAIHSGREVLILTTGHINGAPGLGWGDPKSDFYALSLEQAQERIASLLSNHSRIWHYRIYDTVNDPSGSLRQLLGAGATLIEERRFSGSANLLVQGFLPDLRTTETPYGAASAGVGDALRVYVPECCGSARAGDTLYADVYWSVEEDIRADVATSIRLVDAAGRVWSQPVDRKPLGSMFRASLWPDGVVLPDPQRLPIPSDTPPGEYGVDLVAYDPATGHPLESSCDGSGDRLSCFGAGRLRLGTVQVDLPAVPDGSDHTPVARFDYIELLSASSPANSVRSGDVVPVELRWRARESDYSDDYLVVLELVDEEGEVLSSNAGRPADGQYPTSLWKSGYIVRDLREIAVPGDSQQGRATLSVGMQRASDGLRLSARSGVLGLRRADSVQVHELTIAH